MLDSASNRARGMPKSTRPALVSVSGTCIVQVRCVILSSIEEEFGGVMPGVVRF